MQSFATVLNTPAILERLFSAVQNSITEEGSLISLFDYIEYTTNHPDIKVIIQDLEKEKNKAYKRSDKLKPSALTEDLKQIEIWHCWYALKFIPEISRSTFGGAASSGHHLPKEEGEYFVNFLIIKQDSKRNKDYTNEPEIKRYKDQLSRLHTYFLQKLNESSTSSEQLFGHKLYFYPTEGIAAYRGASHTFDVGTKGRELLNLLSTPKNTPLELRYVQERCNDRISKENHIFKENGDVLDTIRHIKKILKVKKGEYFPIFKAGKAFIWKEI